jgi:hypothetical protein
MKTQPTLIVVSALLMLRSSEAAFVNGVERFDGTTFDTTIWEQRYNDSKGGISQNNAITLDATDGTYERGYVTRSLQVGVGGFVRADVTFDQMGPENTTSDYFGLYLGTKTSTLANALDTAAIGLQSNELGNSVSAEVWHNGGGLGIIMLPHAQPIGTTYTYEIDRISSTSAVFTITDNLGAVVSQTIEFGNTPDNLYIELVATPSVKVTFDNVTIVPEPSFAAFILAALGIIAVANRGLIPVKTTASMRCA